MIRRAPLLLSALAARSLSEGFDSPDCTQRGSLMTNWWVNRLNPQCVSSVDRERRADIKCEETSRFIRAETRLLSEVLSSALSCQLPESVSSDSSVSVLLFFTPLCLSSFRFCFHSAHSISLWHLDISVICFPSSSVWRGYVLLRPFYFLCFTCTNK